MDTREDRIRRRAYEIWEAAGQTGHPEDHWLAAERELADGADGRAGAEPADGASPIDEVEALGAALPRTEQDGGTVQPQRSARIRS